MALGYVTSQHTFFNLNNDISNKSCMQGIVKQKYEIIFTYSVSREKSKCYKNSTGTFVFII